MSLQEIPYKTSLSSNTFHSNTKVSRDNRTVENQLLKELQSFTKSILSQTKNKSEARWTFIFGVLKPILDSLVYDSIRQAVSRSYTLGAEYAVKTINRRKPFFLTDADIQHIKTITNEYATAYWGRLETSFNSKVIQDDPDQILNPAYVDLPIAVSTATRALAEGTRVKAETLLLQPDSNVLHTELTIIRQTQRVAQAAATPTSPSPSILRSRAETISTVKGFLDRQRETAQAVQEGLPVMQFIWMTANNACKNLCDPIRGVTWYVNQPFPFYPPRHPYCRCRLFLIKTST